MAGERTVTSRVVIVVVSGAALLGTILGSVGGTAIALSTSSGAGSDAADQPAAQPTGSATTAGTQASETEETTAADAPVSDPALGHALPASCAALYSAGMVSTLTAAGVALNPSWIYQSADYRQVGTQVSALQPILDTPNKLTCTWTTPGGGSEVGLTTEIVQVTPEQTAQISDKLASIGWTRLDELGGVRWVVQQNLEGNSVGESQFLRDGLWFATQYVNLGVKGYTADMATTVFG